MFVTVDAAAYKESSALDVMSVGSTEVYAEVKIGKEVVRTPATPAAGKAGKDGQRCVFLLQPSCWLVVVCSV